MEAFSRTLGFGGTECGTYLVTLIRLHLHPVWTDGQRRTLGRDVVEAHGPEVPDVHVVHSVGAASTMML